MPTQVQIRGNTQATQEARTLASRELDVNTTDKRIAVHDGTTAGGVPHVNCFDQQNQEFSYASASGTNSLTLTLAQAPAAYQAGQRFVFKAANANTGSVTINVNSLGAKTIKKKSGSGTLVALDSGDIIQDGLYEIYYDGTDFQIILGRASNETLESRAVSASSAEVFNIGSGLVYEFLFNDIVFSTDNVILNVTASIDNDSTYLTSYNYTSKSFSIGDSALTFASGSSSSTGPLNFGGVNIDNAFESADAQIVFFNNNGQTRRANMKWNLLGYENTGGTYSEASGAIQILSTSSITNLKFAPSSGTMTGTIIQKIIGE